FDDASFLIVDATPAEAQVFLDGRFLGTAADLLARALPLAPGRHFAQVIAPGFTPYVIRFAAEPSFSTRLRPALSPERRSVRLTERDTARKAELCLFSSAVALREIGHQSGDPCCHR